MADTDQTDTWTHDCGHPLVPLSDEADHDAACPSCHDLDSLTEPDAIDEETWQANREENFGDSEKVKGT